jgi:hypothetical protein
MQSMSFDALSEDLAKMQKEGRYDVVLANPPSAATDCFRGADIVRRSSSLRVNETTSTSRN